MALAVTVLVGSCTKPLEVDALPKATTRVQLTYYYLSFCSFCQGARAAFQAMPDQYPGELSVHTIEHLEPGAAQAVKALGFRSHGLVIRVGDEIVFRQPDHRVDIEEARAALKRILGPPKGSSVSLR